MRLLVVAEGMRVLRIRDRGRGMLSCRVVGVQCTVRSVGEREGRSGFWGEDGGL